MRDVEGLALRSTLTGLFSGAFDEPLNDEVFNLAALRVFAWQYARNLPYAAFCDRRRRTPGNVEHWTRIPVVPTSAFREIALIAGDPADAQAVFRTSGTTRGAEKRGTHYVSDLSLYHASLIPNFTACVLPDGVKIRMVSLVPDRLEMPDSSLAHMISVLIDEVGAPQSEHCATIDGGIDERRLVDILDSAEAAGEPVCLLGTSLAYVRWLDSLNEQGVTFSLPAGSRLMDTGGYKGQGREVGESTLREMYGELLGIPASHCINEYGMTEMCSQFYDSTLRDAVHGRADARRKLVPPWVRTRVVDPDTLEPVPEGPGLLQHFDLANAGSVMALQTEDVGVAAADGFRLLGRAPGAVPRGCSIAMDLLLDAVAARRR